MSVAGAEADVPFPRRMRLWLSILLFFGFIFIYSQRVGMSVSIVCMVNHTALKDDNIFIDSNTTALNLVRIPLLFLFLKIHL